VSRIFICSISCHILPFASSYCAALAYLPFISTTFVVKNLRTHTRTALLPSSLFNFRCFILPQQAHLCTLISSNVARRKCVGSRPTRRVRLSNMSLCRYELLHARRSRNRVPFLVLKPKPRRLSQSATGVRRSRVLLSSRIFPNRNLDYSWTGGNRGK